MQKLAEHGLTLIELVIAIVIMTLVIGVAVPSIGALSDDAKINDILTTVERAKSACKSHFTDTSKYGNEDSMAGSLTGHQLSQKQETKGWKGPYMERALSNKDNPFGGNVVLYSNFNGGEHKLYYNQFNLTGPSSPRRRGNGNFIAFDGIPMDVAEGVNRALDDGVSGNWKRYGRVQWRNLSGGTLMVYLLHNH
ncbi:MAG: prepilin-type N-terminal cleavage/methylation domain-containing protein [Planctomycetota bacterium]|jgi:prepilin-type N-terminal cleavage/methylation domain-containing protein